MGERGVREYHANGTATGGNDLERTGETAEHGESVPVRGKERRPTILDARENDRLELIAKAHQRSLVWVGVDELRAVRRNTRSVAADADRVLLEVDAISAHRR